MPSKKNRASRKPKNRTQVPPRSASDPDPTPAQSLDLLRKLLKEGDGTATALQSLGIGGLDTQVKTLLRRALASRLLAPDMAKRLGVNHVRGILLHGPPGTGKTLIARQLAALLHTAEPKLISGPELLSMWVGKSEQNIRKIFEEAEQEFKDKGEYAQLHVIIFDEIDALTRKRGSTRDSSGVIDSCVNQLLTKIDGLQSIHNILVIGTTNRKDLLDDALLRPGRLEVHVEVGLPDSKGREQIFHVHTRGFASEGCLGNDVDFTELARLTPNFTGAEIEGVVKGGLSFAIQRQISEEGPLNLGMGDTRRAIGESKPHYGAQHQWLRHQQLGFVPFRPEVTTLLQSVLSTLSKARSSKLPLASILLMGPPGAGKTAWLARLGSLAKGFNFRRQVTSQELVGLADDAACDALVQAVVDAHQCPASLLLLDDIDALALYTPLQGGRASPVRLHTLLSLLSRTPAKKGRVGVIVATTSLPEKTLKTLGMWDKFNLRLSLPLVETKEHVSALLGKQTEHQQLLESNGPWTVRGVLQWNALQIDQKTEGDWNVVRLCA